MKNILNIYKRDIKRKKRFKTQELPHFNLIYF